MNDVFTNPGDLTYAIIAKAQGWAPRVPSIQQQMVELIQPGRAIGFRTESGSMYEMTIYTDMTTVLLKVDEEDDGVKEVAKGELLGAHDRNREVYGIVVREPSGRQYKTSAVVKVWLSYDAIAGRSHHEPV